MTSPHETTFGNAVVTPDERRQRIRRVFEAVAPRYDLMNDLMSFGIHRLWKRRMAAVCGSPRAIGCDMALDLAGGTGDVARLLAARGWRASVCDPSRGMMASGRRHGDDRDDRDALRWLAGEAERLPLADASLDLLTIAFGIRNVTRLPVALAEIRRVLRPGGRLVCLEFSRPAFWLAPAYDLYSRLVIPRLGAAVAGQPEAYHYLVESIRRFPDQREFAGLIAGAGLGRVRWENLSFGIACLHTAEAP